MKGSRAGGVDRCSPRQALIAEMGSRSADHDVAVDTHTAAQMLGLAAKTLVNWRALGMGPPAIKYPGRGGPVRYLVSDLRNWLDQHRVSRDQEQHKGAQRCAERARHFGHGRHLNQKEI